jgi:hypothetical protein
MSKDPRRLSLIGMFVSAVDPSSKILQRSHGLVSHHASDHYYRVGQHTPWCNGY